MEGKASFTVPEPPQLLGKENLEEWMVAVQYYFQWHGINQYLAASIAEPEDAVEKQRWERDRLKGTIILHSTLTNKKIRELLTNSGWNPHKDRDPGAIYSLVTRTIPSKHEEALFHLYVEFVSLNRAKYDSLAAFESRVIYLKNRLEALNCMPPEKGNLIVVINALKSTYPEWHKALMYDFARSNLDWEKLMEEVSDHARYELLQRSRMETRLLHADLDQAFEQTWSHRRLSTADILCWLSYPNAFNLSQPLEFFSISCDSHLFVGDEGNKSWL